MKILLYLTFLLHYYSYAQIPGTWEAYPSLCVKCNDPAAMDFYDSNNGLLVTASHYFGPNVGIVWYSYRTTNGGKNWSKSLDTINAIVFGASYDGQKSMRYFAGGQASMFSLGQHVYSLDHGRKWFVSPNSSYVDIAARIENLSTILKFSTTDMSGMRGVVFVSYDSGFTYETKKILFVDSNHAFRSPCFVDSNEIWVRVMAGGLNDPEFLYHSVDGGITWEEIYPYGEPLPGAFSFFASDGIIAGANRGTIYLLHNRYKALSPDQKFLDILYTTDNGVTWTGDSTNIDMTKPNYEFLTRYLYNPSGTQLWAVHKDNKTIAYSPNNGLNWYYDSTTFRNENITFMLWKDSTQGYVVTYTDSIVNFYKYIPPQSSVEHGRPDFNSKYYFTIHPSVVNGSLVSVTAVRPLGGVFEVHDVLGRQYISKTINLHAKGATTLLDVGDFTSGVYLLTVRMGSEAITARFVKQ